MLGKEECMDIWVLKRRGYSDRAVSRRLGIDRRTVRKYMESGEFPQYRKVVRVSKLEPYFGLIGDWLGQDDFQATWIYRRLVSLGYTGSYEVVKRYVKGLKRERDRVAYIRFETEPGRQAQVDFGDFQVLGFDGSVRTVYVFVMVLGYSRHMYVEFVDNCGLVGFLDCHIRAFGYLGGVPAEILYDNLRNVVVRRLLGRVHFNDRFWDFSRHYGFKPVPCPPYSPWVKGKVERPVQYVRESFWRGYGYSGLEQANRDVSAWVEEAFQRVHGTTQERVRDRFARERPYLGSIPRRDYDTSEIFIRKVYKDCCVRYGGNWYVVPHRVVGEKVLLKVKAGVIRIFWDDQLLASYSIPEGKGNLIQDPAFYAALRADQSQFLRKYARRRGKGRAIPGTLPSPALSLPVEKRPLAFYEGLLAFPSVSESGNGGGA
jgi:transposase